MSIRIDMTQRTIRTTKSFSKWLKALRDRKAQTIIAARIERIAAGNLGDVKPLGKGLNEVRINYGPGYRVYYTERDGAVVLLLAGGDKSTQSRDIAAAREMLK